MSIFLTIVASPEKLHKRLMRLCNTINSRLEIDRLNRLVDIFLTSAEMRVEGRRDLTLDYWRKNVDNLLQFQGMDVLQGKGSVSNAEMESYAKNVYANFDAKRKQQEAQQADADDLKLLEDLERKIINQNKSNEQ